MIRSKEFANRFYLEYLVGTGLATRGVEIARDGETMVLRVNFELTERMIDALTRPVPDDEREKLTPNYAELFPGFAQTEEKS